MRDANRPQPLTWSILVATTIIIATTTTSSPNAAVSIGASAFAPCSTFTKRSIRNNLHNRDHDRNTNRNRKGSTTPTTTTFVRSSSSSNEDLSNGAFFDGSTQSPIQPSISTQSQSSSSSSQLSINPNPTPTTNPNTKTIPKDVIIIGGGLAGLSTALHISLHSTHQITILEKEDPTLQASKTPAASFAAAGMLAPHSERLPSGPLLKLCLESRDMYAEYVSLVESLISHCGEDAKRYLWNKDGEETNGLQEWEVGYAANGGFLAPAFAGDSVATWSPPQHNDDDGNASASAIWLDEVQVHEMEPALHHDVIGGWWFPEDASVDARRLTCALRAACVERGVSFLHGNGHAASSLELGNGICRGVRLDDGRVMTANAVVVANGSWMRNLLPVPIAPHKGQSFSLRMPQGVNVQPLLKRVLFAQDTYIVPKADGRIVVGATVETGTFDCDVTPSGMMHCMANAVQLIPALGDLPVEESWAGLRPTTPDKGPILGRTVWDNLFLAGGYWRNGVLLAPKTGQLIGDLVIRKGKRLASDSDEDLITAFQWDRFMAKDGGKALAANTRYAASMHPVHKRSSGVGVAAAVGTELGFYSGADSAREERKRDREALFNDVGLSTDEEDAFEKAALLGLDDATAFTSFGESIVKPRTKKNTMDEVDVDVDVGVQPFEGSPDALTVGYASAPTSSDERNDVAREDTTTTVTDDSHDLDSIYKKIQENKAKVAASGDSTVQMSKSVDDDEERPDLGFQIFHVEKGTRTVREVPPYTSPQELLKQIDDEKRPVVNMQEQEQTKQQEIEDSTESTDEENDSSASSTYNEKTFDGYQTIQAANSRTSRKEELEAMKKARMSNRMDTSQIDESKIGVMTEGDHTDTTVEENDSSASITYNEKTFDGYQTIQAANSRTSRKEELEAMKKSRMSNRMDASQIDESKIGAIIEDNSDNSEDVDMSTIYEQIRTNKVAPSEMGSSIDSSKDQADPGFRIYHVDNKTRKTREVPPYTSPGEFLKANKEGETEQAWGE